MKAISTVILLLIVMFSDRMLAVNESQYEDDEPDDSG
jgi:hypothetical protein